VRRKRWVEQMSRTEEKEISCIASVGNPERKLPFGKPGLTQGNDFKICLKQIGRVAVGLRCVTQIGKCGEFL
jgi:hypothetical protein